MSRSAGLALEAILLTAPPAMGADTVADRVFGAGLLADVTQPVLLRYRYEMTGQGIDTPYASHIDVDVRDIAADGGKSVYLDMFEGADHRSLGPIAAREQNPMVLAFLQRDVTRMAKLTGGAAVYYQQQVPRAFTQAAESEPFEVGLGDRKLPGLRLVIKPLANEPHIGRFPQYRDKTYEFVVADGIPGGIYRVASRTPDPKDGHVILEETVTFKGATP